MLVRTPYEDMIRGIVEEVLDRNEPLIVDSLGEIDTIVDLDEIDDEVYTCTEMPTSEQAIVVLENGRNVCWESSHWYDLSPLDSIRKQAYETMVNDVKETLEMHWRVLKALFMETGDADDTFDVYSKI